MQQRPFRHLDGNFFTKKNEDEGGRKKNTFSWSQHCGLGMFSSCSCCCYALIGICQRCCVLVVKSSDASQLFFLRVVEICVCYLFSFHSFPLSLWLCVHKRGNKGTPNRPLLIMSVIHYLPCKTVPLVVQYNSGNCGQFIFYHMQKQNVIIIPNHQQLYAKWKLSRNMYTLHTRFCTFGAHLYAQSVFVNKISAAELRRKLSKSALLVGSRRNFFLSCLATSVGFVA